MKLILFVFILIQSISVFAEAVFVPPGKIIHLGYHQMYYDCRGDKTPTVVIDVGLGDASANWIKIADALSEDTRVCTYDRSGYGYSGVGPDARTTAQIADELDVLLEFASIPGPYVLVGHSFGGYTAQYFATTYPDKTVGLVLVDSSHSDQIERLKPMEKHRDSDKKINILKPAISSEEYNELEKRWYQLNQSRKATFTLMDEMKYFGRSAEQVGKARKKLTIPTAVITRGKEFLPYVEGVSMEDVWQNMQKELLELSSNSWQVIAENSGHNIYKDEPEIIINNIKKVVREARNQRHIADMQ